MSSLRNVECFLVLNGLGLEKRKPEGGMGGGEGWRGAEKGRERVLHAFSFERFSKCQDHACNGKDGLGTRLCMYYCNALNNGLGQLSSLWWIVKI